MWWAFEDLLGPGTGIELVKSLGEGSRMVACWESADLMVWAWVGSLRDAPLGRVSGTVKRIVS